MIQKRKFCQSRFDAYHRVNSAPVGDGEPDAKAKNKRTADAGDAPPILLSPNLSAQAKVPEPTRSDVLSARRTSSSGQSTPKCQCVCQGWAEVLIRRPSGNMSWVMRLQNRRSARVGELDVCGSDTWWGAAGDPRALTCEYRDLSPPPKGIIFENFQSGIGIGFCFLGLR